MTSVEIESRDCQDIREPTVLSSTVFVFEKERLGSTKNFFSMIQFCARENERGPQKHCLWDGLNLDRWVSVGFLRR